MTAAEIHPRNLLLSGFKAALDRVNGATAVQQALQHQPLSWPGSVDLIAIGKAAAAMAKGAEMVLGGRLRRGLVITKQGHLERVADQRFQYLESDHPVPGEASLLAGAALLEFCQQIPEGQGVLVCFSGGTSSLVEVLPEGLTLQALADLTRQLLGGGLDIASMNAFRRSVSLIKGGRLAAQLEGHPVEVLLISDVPGDDPAVIGSGPLYPPEKTSTPPVLPGVDMDQFSLPALPPAAVFKQISHRVIANLEMAKQAAADVLKCQGLPVQLHSEFLDAEVSTVAEQLAVYLQSAPVGVHIWGGETVVHLPQNPGKGGRNQHLALLLAEWIRGQKGLTILVAGTDGTDGPTEDAGGLVDGDSCLRGEQAGLDIQEALTRFDAGRFLEASGDLVSTGPTGTNVMDLVMAIKW